ncbi:MAG: hypothetical protein RMJ19_10510, partial [Gemmatales bacterium]|nr:hypothetical protein [Gemmatales bacterium]MDW8176092.1 hypothetical protein [Gemmatales bacterium]
CPSDGAAITLAAGSGKHLEGERVIAIKRGRSSCDSRKADWRERRKGKTIRVMEITLTAMKKTLQQQ